MNIDLKSEKYQGLNDEQVREKQKAEGLNELPSSKPKNFIALAWGVIKEPMFLLLVSCGTLYLILGDIQEGIMLLGFVFVIMGIEFYQEKKTENALDALKDMASPRALVIREGIEKRIAGRDVVTCDLIILQEGDRVPADATVIYSVNLMADESMLTGESVSVRKSEWNGTDKNILPGGDDLPFVYSGSMIVQGNGIVKVTAIGQTAGNHRYFALCGGGPGFYPHPRRSAKRFFGRNNAGNGHVARRISGGTHRFYGTRSMADVEKKCADPQTVSC
jgi:Ca2+-transporting ATPase